MCHVTGFAVRTLFIFVLPPHPSYRFSINRVINCPTKRSSPNGSIIPRRTRAERTCSNLLQFHLPPRLYLLIIVKLASVFRSATAKSLQGLACRSRCLDGERGLRDWGKVKHIIISILLITCHHKSKTFPSWRNLSRIVLLGQCSQRICRPLRLCCR